jgi:spore coat protein CotH
MRFRFVLFFFISVSNVLVSISQTLTTSNLPIVIIETDNGATIPDDPKISATMKVIDNGPGTINSVNDSPNNYDGRIAIETRGSSSQFFFPKKQYGLELKSKAFADSSASLMGMPVEEDWILFAPYNDKTLMRDFLAYKLGRDMGHYATRTRFCEVILNGRYDGIYILLEKIKRDKNRVDVSKLDPEDVSGDDVTGGYIVKIDKTTGESSGGFNSAYRSPGGTANQTTFFQIDYPEPEDIRPEQFNYIRGYIREFEDALMSSNYKDPFVGYRRYIDVPSFIDFMIMNELTKNVDGYRISTYFHKKKSDENGGKIFMGPIWDFNLGFGNADYCTKGNPQGFVLEFNNLCPADGALIPFWWNRLLTDPAFRKELGLRWSELRETSLKTGTVLSYIDSVASAMTEARSRNFVRWPVIGQWVWPNYFVGSTYEREVDFLKDFITDRMEWLDSHWLDYVTPADDPLAVTYDFRVLPDPIDGNIAMTYTLPDVETTIVIEMLDSRGAMIEKIVDEGVGPGVYLRYLDFREPSGFFLFRFTTGSGYVTTTKHVRVP